MKKAIRVLVVGGVMFISAFIGVMVEYYASREDRENLAYYEKTHLWKTGGLGGFGYYDLRSFDGGKLWYAVNLDDEGALVILGTAEKVFPGLLAYLAAWDALEAHVKEHGPISLSGARTPDELKLLETLEAAGFTIKKKNGE